MRNTMYENLEIEVIYFDSEDVITTSQGGGVESEEVGE